MRALLLTVMMLCACLSVPGCVGEQEEIMCEDDGVVLTQYEWYECEFQILAQSGTVNIELTNTGDSPVNIFTVHSVEYDTWFDCPEDGGLPYEESDHRHHGFYYIGELSEMDSMSSSLSGELEISLPNSDGETSYSVLFDHPNSCDDEDASTPVANITLKVSVT